MTTTTTYQEEERPMRIKIATPIVDDYCDCRCCVCGEIKPLWSTFAGPDEDGVVVDPLCQDCARKEFHDNWLHALGF
jgi:hypothetical protein